MLVKINDRLTATLGVNHNVISQLQIKYLELFPSPYHQQVF
jgi:hypothetical protein